MPFDALDRLQKNGKRAAEVAGVLAKYGLADLLRWLDVDWIQNRLRSADGQVLHDQPLPVRIRLALADLGTTFIKLGQVLSTRPDLVGAELATELAQLQAATTPDPPATARATVESELGRPLEELFAAFAPQAFASASIAQVHAATLFDGTEVVVKVQRADVRQRAEADLEILDALARLAERHSNLLRPYQPIAVARHFRRMLQRELDFTYERRALDAFARRFAGDPTVRFPASMPALSSKSVLTMERLDGIAAADTAALRASGADLGLFARRGAAIYLAMLFRDSVYHADPHPGNLLLLPGNVVGVLDCGMVGRIDPELRLQVESLLFAAVERDAAELAEIVLRVGKAPLDTDRAALAGDLDEFLADYVDHPLHDLDVGGALRNLFDLVRRYGIVLPAPLSLLLRTLLVLDGTSRSLDRDFSLAELIEPFYESALRRRLSPRALARRLRRSFRDWDRLLDTLPRDLRDVLGRLRGGNLRMRLEHGHLDAVLNRLTLGILVAALVLGGSALWASDAPPRLGGVSVPAALLYALAARLGWRLLRAIRRSGEL
ncbi:MAG: AarF/ABC1/UbiB kinase family protein [Planctomycetes bacterium]|nr:AarF/ABC1/UbiB kinase family protein [Planctomycetota bacterium]